MLGKTTDRNVLEKHARSEQQTGPTKRMTDILGARFKATALRASQVRLQSQAVPKQARQPEWVYLPCSMESLGVPPNAASAVIDKTLLLQQTAPARNRPETKARKSSTRLA